METRKKNKIKEIDWKEIAKDLRADLLATPFAYRSTHYYK
jgi:hypothetical protein